MVNEAGWSYWSVIPRIKPGSIKGLERELQGGDFQAAGNKAGDTLGTNIGTSANKRVGLMSKGIIAPLLTAVAAVKVKDFIGDSLGEARESQKVGALTASIIKSTGGAAKITARDVDRLSSSISKKTGVDDEAIASGANLLLTFKNVKREGSGLEDIFGRATIAAADLSAAGFGDMAGTAKQLGKALNDPLKGISALGRSGVTFTEQQKAQIKELVKQNDLLGAQKIILGEVESQVGGAAEATATMGEKSKVAWDNIKEGFGTALLPLVDDMQEAFLEKGVPAAEKFVGWFQEKGVPALREFGDVAGPLAKSTLPAIGTSLGIVADGAKAIAPAVKSIVDSFNSLPKAAQTAILAGVAVTAVANKATDLLPIPTPKPKPKPKGNPAVFGGPAVIAASLVAFAGLDSAKESLDDINRASKDARDESGKLAATFSKNGKASAESLALIRDQFSKGRIGELASDLGVDVDKLARSFARSGTEGKYVKEVLADLDDQYSKTSEIASDAFGNTLGLLPGVPREGESAKIADFTRAIGELGEEYDTAGDKAYKNGNQTRDLTSLMLGGDSTARKLAKSFDVLGDKNAKPKITTPGMGAAIGSAGVLIGQLAAIDGKDVTAIVRTKNIGVNLGRIIGQLNQIKDKGSSGGGRVRGGPSFSGGGWTGPGSRLEPAGLVHADEFVTKKSSRQSIERQAPGALDEMNRTGQLVTAGGGGDMLVPLLKQLIDAVEAGQRVSIDGHEFAQVVADANHRINRLSRGNR